MQWKRIFYYLLINVVISASTTLIVLNVWERTHNEALEQAALLIAMPSPGAANDASQAFELTDVPSVALQPYTVQPDETLSEIALAYDIDVEDLLALNGKTDADSIGAGETIYVPAATDEPLEATSVAQVSQATQGSTLEVSGEGKIIINLVVGIGDLSTERIVLKNIGNSKQSLEGWHLSDEGGNSYAFGKVTLYDGGEMRVNTRADVDTSIDLYWGLSDAVWQIGEVVTLIDARGEEVDRYQIP